jgi:hypothetical protein
LGILLGVVLFIIAYILYFPLTIINFLLVRKKGYFRDSAITIDKLANREFRTLWNKVLILPNGYQFGDINETISAVLGRNILKNKLTKTGKVLVWVLTEKHCIDAITLKE